MKLFQKIESPFTKEAALYPLSDNDAMWGSEILATLYKQHAYLGRYEVNMVVEQQDNSLGYMYGSFLVKNPSSTPPPVQAHGKTIKQEAPEAQTVKIPVIVEAGKVYSFDVYIDPAGNFMPLSEDRLEQSLFDHNNYSAVPMGDSKPYPEDGDSMQPQVPNTGLGYGSAGRNTVFKGASVLEHMLNQVDNTTKAEFVKRAEQDAWLNSRISKNPIFRTSIEKISSHQTPVAKLDTHWAHSADFVILEKTAGGFELKAQSPSGGVETVATFGRKVPSELVDLSKEAIEWGAVLHTFNPVETIKYALPDEHIKEASVTGVYALMEKTGESTKGVVITDVRNLHGDKTGLSLVMTKRGAALQDTVVGAKCGRVDFTKISGQTPRGEGVFLVKAGTVTEPVTIENYISTPTGYEYIYQDSWGQKGILKEGACLLPMSLGNGNFMIPEGSRFVPLEFTGGVMETASSISKISSADHTVGKVSIFADGGKFHISGTPVEKYADDQSVSYSDALAVLGRLGVSGEFAQTKLAECATTEVVHFVPLLAEEQEKVAAQVINLKDYADSIKTDLLKEAAELGADQETVDSVLSLNFVTPENVTGYIDAIPEYEQCLSRLSELLIGSRLGLPDVKESVVLTVLRALNKVITNLKKLELRVNTTE